MFCFSEWNVDSTLFFAGWIELLFNDYPCAAITSFQDPFLLVQNENLLSCDG